MLNIDTLEQSKVKAMTDLAEAVRNNDEKGMQKAMEDWGNIVQSVVVAEAKGILNTADTTILATRGVRQLTSQETKYYNYLIDNMKQEAKTIAGVDAVMPETVFESVLDDMKESHPLLNYINFKNTTAVTRWVYNKMGEQRAVWGALNTAFKQELEGEIATFETTLCKLTAYMFISKDMLNLGPAWIDRYVRNVLSEACAVGLEVGIVDGTGKDMPIGMTRDVSDNVTITGGEYPRKSEIAITSLDVATYGTIIAMLTKTPAGHTRAVPRVLALCNPVDYFAKIMPATTMLLQDGTYKNNILPYPTDFIQSVGVPEGKMIIGIAERYFMGLGTSKTGQIDYDDSYKYLEDWRTYTIRLYGNGRPLDNNAFVLLDISNLEATMPTVQMKNYNETRLADLKIGNLTFDKSFDKNTIYYTTETSSATNTITATAKDTEAVITVSVNGSTIENGTSATWNEGMNNVKVTVSVGGDDRVYTVTVVKV